MAKFSNDSGLMNDVSLVMKLSCLTFYSNHMVTTGHKSKI